MRDVHIDPANPKSTYTRNARGDRFSSMARFRIDIKRGILDVGIEWGLPPFMVANTLWGKAKNSFKFQRHPAADLVWPIWRLDRT